MSGDPPRAARIDSTPPPSGLRVSSASIPLMTATSAEPSAVRNTSSSTAIRPSRTPMRPTANVFEAGVPGSPATPPAPLPSAVPPPAERGPGAGPGRIHRPCRSRRTASARPSSSTASITTGFERTVRHWGRIRMAWKDTEGPFAASPAPVRTSVPTTAGTGKTWNRMRPMVTGAPSTAVARRSASRRSASGSSARYAAKPAPSRSTAAIATDSRHPRRPVMRVSSRFEEGG